MKKVSLFVNEKKDASGAISEKVLDILNESNIEVLMPDTAENKKIAGKARLVSENDFYSSSECIITLGGDGTILNNAAPAALNGIPILGINLGNVGFMTELEQDRLSELKRLASDDFGISERMMIEAEVSGKGSLVALNECAISDASGMKLIGLKVSEKSGLVTDIRADGVIFSTPTGSTGYSFSAGGAVMDTSLECIGMQTICSYYLKDSHQMIFSPDSIFTVSEIKNDENTVIICADGRQKIHLSPEDTVRICRSQYKTKLIYFEDRNFYDVFYNKF